MRWPHMIGICKNGWVNYCISSTELTSSFITPFSQFRHSLSSVMDSGKADSVLEALILIPYQPAFIHNIHLYVDIDHIEYEHIVGKVEAHWYTMYNYPGHFYYSDVTTHSRLITTKLRKKSIKFYDDDYSLISSLAELSNYRQGFLRSRASALVVNCL